MVTHSSISSKYSYPLNLYPQISAFAVYTYIFAVGKISEKIRAEEDMIDMIRSPMDEVVQVIQNAEN